MGHHSKLAKKFRIFGCGCIILIILVATITIVAFNITGIAGSAGQWLSKAYNGIVSILPKNITLPQGLKLPEVPTGIENLLKLSPKEQIQLGREVAKQQELDKNSYSNPIIDEVKNKMVKSLPAQYRGPEELGGWDWDIREVHTEEGKVNALALPGGNIFLYDGIIKLAENKPEQLALIIGHEMAHVAEEHAAEKLRTAGLLKSVSDLVIRYSNGGEEGAFSEAMRIMATKLGQQIVEMQFSQVVEYKADDLGLEFLISAGYNPSNGLKVLERMDSLNQSKVGTDPVLARFFSTHPPMKNRIQRLRVKLSQ